MHEVGPGVRRVRPGDRVVVPFVCGCGQCPWCASGNSHVCPDQWQPGFHGPGCYAELVAIPWADANAVALPDDLPFDVAAGLGCRFATAYRGVVDVARVGDGETVAVFGCGGVGLAAVMVARSRGARVVGIDVSESALALAADVGADVTVDASAGDGVEQVLAVAPDGVDVAVDAVGSVVTASSATRSLRTHGRHLQIGLLPPAQVGDRATVPMHTVVSRELVVLGSHGMPAAGYPRMLADIAAGRLDPGRLVTRRIALGDVPAALVGLSDGTEPGVTVIHP